MISSSSPLATPGAENNNSSGDASPEFSRSGHESTDESNAIKMDRMSGYGDEHEKPLSESIKKEPTGSESPTQEAVLEALKKCAEMASERRRIYEEQQRKLAEKEREIAAEEQKLTNNFAQLHETPGFSRTGKKQQSVSRRRRHNSKRGPQLMQQLPQPFFQPPPTQRSLNSYCRELIEELNALDRMFGYGTVGFIPLQMRCLIAEVIQRIESCLGREQSQRYIRPLREALGDVPLLETISQPPLRVPPSMLRRQRDASSPKEPSSPKRTPSSKTLSPKESSPASPPQESSSNVSSTQLSSKSTPEPALDQSTTSQKTAATDQQQSPKQKSSPSSAKQQPSSGKKSPRGLQQSRKNLPPILEATVSSPLRVVYIDGMPKDVGFGRGDAGRLSLGVWKSAKIYIPEVNGYSFIGRILGPRGISVRRLETETGCKILIRGRGSIKDEQREKYLMNRTGWAHLNDQLHVLISANDESGARCRERLERGIDAIQRLLTPQYDEYKRQQLMQLAILNGTYRP